MLSHLFPKALYPTPITEPEALYIVESREMPSQYDHARIIKAIDFVISDLVRSDGLIAGWATYLVNSHRVTGKNCNCEDANFAYCSGNQALDRSCKHLIAVEIWQGCTAIREAVAVVHRLTPVQREREAVLLEELGF